MSINYSRTDRQTPSDQLHRPTPPMQQPGAVTPRPDVERAVQATPPHIRTQLGTEAAEALALLTRHLPDTETVQMISSVAVRAGVEANSILALTDHRLIFVAPAPQAVGFRLASLTKTQLSTGYLFLEGDTGEYSLGMADDAWGKQFVQQVKRAAAVAVLAGR
jgi:hypothetical protein